MRRSMCRGEIFLSPEFGTKFQREVLIVLKIREFPYNTVQDKLRVASKPKVLNLFSRFDTIMACDGRMDRHGAIANT